MENKTSFNTILAIVSMVIVSVIAFIVFNQQNVQSIGESYKNGLDKQLEVDSANFDKAMQEQLKQVAEQIKQSGGATLGGVDFVPADSCKK